MSKSAPPAAPRDDDDLPEPPRLRALRRLVTLLTAASVLGVMVVAGALVIRLGQPLSPGFDLRAVEAETLTAPPGEAIVAAGAARGALILVTRDAEGQERLRLYDAATGVLSRSVEIVRAP